MDFEIKAFLDTHDVTLKLNLMTGGMEIIGMSGHCAEIKEQTDFCAFVKEYLNKNIIYKEDIYKFQILLNLEQLKKKCKPGICEVLFSYRRMEGRRAVWIRVMIAVPKDFSEEHPDILYFGRILSSNEVDIEEIKSAYYVKMYKMMRFNLTTGECYTIRQRYAEEKALKRQGTSIGVQDWSKSESRFVHPEDMDRFVETVDPRNVEKHFQMGNTELVLYFRRRIGTLYRWVRMQIRPTTEFSAEWLDMIYLIEDVHETLLGLLDRQVIKLYTEQSPGVSMLHQSYYENVLRLLSYFTQNFIDFYLIDLENDLYIKYKISAQNISGEKPYIDTYSTVALKFLEEKLSDGQTSRLQPYLTAKGIQELMKDKSSIEYSFRLNSGQRVKTICTKLDEVNGIATKVICQTVPVESEKKLKVRTFGNFEVFDESDRRIDFTRKQSKQLLAYLIDQRGYPVSTRDVVVDVLEKNSNDQNAIKYVSTLVRAAVKDLEAAGFSDIILKEWNSLKINVKMVDCDYYHLMDGDTSFWKYYHNEYMKEYSWAEETNAEILHLSSHQMI